MSKYCVDLKIRKLLKSHTLLEPVETSFWFVSKCILLPWDSLIHSGQPIIARYFLDIFHRFYIFINCESHRSLLDIFFIVNMHKMSLCLLIEHQLHVYSTWIETEVNHGGHRKDIVRISSCPSHMTWYWFWWVECLQNHSLPIWINLTVSKISKRRLCVLICLYNSIYKPCNSLAVEMIWCKILCNFAFHTKNNVCNKKMIVSEK